MLKCFAGHHSQLRTSQVLPRSFRNTETYCLRKGVKKYGWALFICTGRGLGVFKYNIIIVGEGGKEVLC